MIVINIIDVKCQKGYDKTTDSNLQECVMPYP